MIFERLIRRVIPSVAALSYNPVFAWLADAIAAIVNVAYPEWRRLPPNHLRIRIGVNNRIFFNQTHFIGFGTDLWFYWLSNGYIAPDSVVVEFGCGCGRMAWPLRGGWFKGKYIGIDIDGEMLDWCAKHFDDRFAFHKSTHCSLTYHGGETLASVAYSVPYPEQSADFIFSTSLLTHLLEFELANYAQESFRLAKDGAVVLMYFFSYQAVAKGGRWSFRYRSGNAYVENLRYPEAAVAYDTDFMVKMFRAAGFADVAVFEDPKQSFLICRR